MRLEDWELHNHVHAKLNSFSKRLVISANKGQWWMEQLSIVRMGTSPTTTNHYFLRVDSRQLQEALPLNIMLLL
ncbi:conserved hypothetical protein [Ricinus communis]|uniref:Uncharacterized protein n=1 Tax=Ricinus communis TaxID=3988 RepID=B9RZI5_RICCO|nr:conserved hypothetical protein [Ricinus communis]